VYEALDKDNSKKVALKTLRSLSADGSSASRTSFARCKTSRTRTS